VYITSACCYFGGSAVFAVIVFTVSLIKIKIDVDSHRIYIGYSNAPALQDETRVPHGTCHGPRGPDFFCTSCFLHPNFLPFFVCVVSFARECFFGKLDFFYRRALEELEQES
jgi:hypothetical protein